MACPVTRVVKTNSRLKVRKTIIDTLAGHSILLKLQTLFADLFNEGKPRTNTILKSRNRKKLVQKRE